MRAVSLIGGVGASSRGGSFAARSAWVSQSSSSHASGTFCALDLDMVTRVDCSEVRKGGGSSDERVGMPTSCVCVKQRDRWFGGRTKRSEG